MVGQGLGEAVERVEGVAGKRRRHDPLVVRLVDVLVDERVVQASVDPVDAEVGEEQEERELQVRVPPAGAVLDPIVQLRVAAHLGHEGRHHEDRHDGDGRHGLADLLPDLVPQEARMRQVDLVVHDHVRQRRAQEVDEQTEDPARRSVSGVARARSVDGPRRMPGHGLHHSPAHGEDARHLPIDVVAGPGAHVRPLGRAHLEVLAGGVVLVAVDRRRQLPPAREGRIERGGFGRGILDGAERRRRRRGRQHARVDAVQEERVEDLERDVHRDLVGGGGEGRRTIDFLPCRSIFSGSFCSFPHWRFFVPLDRGGTFGRLGPCSGQKGKNDIFFTALHKSLAVPKNETVAKQR